MTDRFFSRAVIPTNSLYLIREKSKKIDINDLIYYLKGTAQKMDRSFKSKPHRWLTVIGKTQKNCYLNYNRKTMKEKFDIDEIIEAVREIGFGDVWLQELRLRRRYRSTPFDFIHKNAPLTPGSKAEIYVLKYLIQLQREGQIDKIHARHLPLIECLSNPRGAHLASEDMGSLEFIKWYNKITGGLVMLKTVEKVSESTFKDLGITEPE